MFSQIHAGGDRMMKLVNALLEVAYMDTPVATQESGGFDWSALARQAVASLQQQAQSRGLRLVLLDPWPALPVSGRLSASASGHAMRYSPPGGRSELMAADRGNCGLELRVRDQGPGVPEDERERVFEAFVLGSRTRDGSAGTGLGLTLARKIMNVHGGRIHLEAPVAGGTEVVMWMPVRPVAVPVAVPEDEAVAAVV